MVERAQQLVALRHWNLQALFGRLARLAFAHERLAAVLLRHRVSSLTAMGHIPDFFGCKGKVYQAVTHIETLKRELGPYEWSDRPAFEDETKRVLIVAEPEDDPDEHVVRVATMPHRFLGILALTIGDVIHNLRSALDHAMWQLALERYDGTPPIPQRIGFPLAHDRASFWGKEVVKNDLLQTSAEVVERTQPYNRPDGSLLRAIHNLNIRDKHKLLIPMLATPREFTPFPARALMVRNLRAGKRIRMGAEVMRVRFDPSDPNFQIKMEAHLLPEISLSQWGFPIAFLNQCVVAVGDTIDMLEAGIPHADPPALGLEVPPER